jgi:hypothetical protein
MILKEKHQEAIEYLARYKFLTSSLFLLLGLYKNRGDITNSLKVLVDMKRPLIKKVTMGIYPGKGKLEDIYYLTNYGKKFLMEELFYSEDKIKIPKSNSIIPKKDYAHKISMIWFNVLMSKWLQENDGSVEFLNYDFDKVGNNRSTGSSDNVTSINKISLGGVSFIPDIITKINIDNKDFLFLFEQHNGNDTKRLFKQLYPHLEALTYGVVRKQYNFEKSHRVAIVCEFESVKKSVIKRLQESKEFDKFHKFFIFKTNDELKEEFFNNWTQVDGKLVGFTST